MKTPEDAEALANSLVKTAQVMGKKASALITNMEIPLGKKIGNFLEIEETIDCLQGKGPQDIMDLTYALATEMIILGKQVEGKSVTKEEALAQCKEAVTSGKALELFLQNVTDQGGNPQEVLREVNVRRSPHHATVTAQEDGFITLDAYKTGLAGVYLGVGRNRTEDPVCPEAGIVILFDETRAGKKGDAILEVYGKDDESLAPALALLGEAITYHKTQPAKQPLIYKEIH